jgi:hypothetical protein
MCSVLKETCWKLALSDVTELSFNVQVPSGGTTALRLTQHVTGANTRNFLGSKARPVRNTDNFTTI